jgi:probable HAF family extracellular repeat protein
LHGFLLKGSTFKSIDFPGAVGTTAIGINDSGTISGYFTDASNLSHGFIYSGNTFTQVDIAGASQTEIAHIKNNGRITGEYTDSNTPNPESHGFTGK